MNGEEVMSKVVFPLFFLLFLVGRPLAGEAVILVLGDSIGAAYGMDRQQGWVALLQQRLLQASLPYRVVNASISGDTTANARQRLPALLARHRPEIVLLEVGGNDGLRGLSLGQMARNLEAMIGMARKGGARVLLLGIQLPPNYGRRYTAAFEERYRELAARLKVPLVPSLVAGIGGDSRLMQSDGIHPAAAAQPLILEMVWEKLSPLLAVGGETVQRAAE
jgi:acyl-CoA thioesterase-1